MRRRAFALLLAVLAMSAAARTRAVRTLDACDGLPATPIACDDGGMSLSASEVEAVVRAAAKALDANAMTIAVVDRAGRPLALYRKPGATGADDDLAVGTARTAAFFSHNQAPLSSRTARYLSGIHFPPGITNTASAALYGIENTNRGCDLNAAFNPGKCVPRAKSLSGGAGTGIVTGKILPNDADPGSVNAGGIPLYRDGKLAGGIGVVGVPGDPQRAEYAALNGAFAAGLAPVPVFPLPFPGNVFIEGIRLPFVGDDIRLTATGVQLDGVVAGSDNGTFIIAPQNGGCASAGYLVGPMSGSISGADVDAIVQRAIDTARRTRAAIRLPLNRYARMVIAVTDLDGTLLALYRMPDATVFSIDVSVAKSRNVIWFSANGIGSFVPPGTAVTNRTIAFGAQPFFPSGIDGGQFDPRPGPWYQSLFVNDLANPCTQGSQPPDLNRNGIVFFAGSTPLYRNGVLIGGLGVSGDGIEQDDYVTYFGAGPLLPPRDIWADRIVVDGVRLPMFKFPRHPEGVDE